MDEIHEFMDLLIQNKIGYTELTDSEVEAYKNVWFETFVPEEKRERAIDSYCFDKDGYCGYLWHVFSYELLDCIKGEAARNLFNESVRKDAVLLLNVDDAACIINDISSFTAQDFDDLYDIILTANDYSWTYVKTHEPDCGPYFYRKPL